MQGLTSEQRDLVQVTWSARHGFILSSEESLLELLLDNRLMNVLASIDHKNSVACFPEKSLLLAAKTPFV